MIEGDTLYLFMLGAIALNLTPGPDMAFVISQGAGGGIHPAAAAALWVGAGTTVHIELAALCLAAFLAQGPAAFVVVRFGGAAYLLWLEVGLFGVKSLDISGTRGSTWAAFKSSALTNMLTPKVAIFFHAFHPQFMRQDGFPCWVQRLLLGLAFNLSGTLVNHFVALWSGAPASQLHRKPRIAFVLNRFAGAAMCGLAFNHALGSRK